MKQFTLYWLDGLREIITGTSIADAFNRAGYGAGALRALDFYAEGIDTGYTWDGSKWIKNS